MLALVLLALVPVMIPQAAFTQDEGAYALQVRSLERGSWQYPYKAAGVDPDGRWFPVVLSTRNGDRFFTYVPHPAYPLLLRGATAVAGRSLGLHLVPLVGALGVAVAAWALAGEVDPTLSRAAFWVAATSPALVNGMLLWAHAPSAAMAGLAATAGARIVRRGLRGPATVAAAAALVAGVLLRSEGLLFAAALALAVAICRFRAGGVRSAVMSLAALGGPAVLAAGAERAWVRSIAGPGYDGLTVRQDPRGSSSFVAGRAAGAFHSLLQGHDASPAAGLPVILVLTVAVGLGYVALHRWRPTSRRDLTMAVGGVVLLYALRLLRHPTEAVTGLVAAWPLMTLGLVLLPRRHRHATVDLCLLAVTLFSAGVLVTEYPGGGGTEWGGRFFSPATVPLAVVATVALASRIRAFPGASRQAATAAVAVMAAATAVFSLATVARGRAAQDRIISAADRHPATVTVTTFEILPRIAWRTHDRLSWMLTDPAGLPDLLTTLRRAGVADVVLITRRGGPAADLSAYGEVRHVAEPALDAAGATLQTLRIGG